MAMKAIKSVTKAAKTASDTAKKAAKSASKAKNMPRKKEGEVDKRPTNTQVKSKFKKMVDELGLSEREVKEILGGNRMDSEGVSRGSNFMRGGAVKRKMRGGGMAKAAKKKMMRGGAVKKK